MIDGARDVLYFPWDKVAALCAALIGVGTVTTFLAARIPKIRHWIERAFQDLLGVTAVRESIETYITDRKQRDETLERAAAKTLDAQQATQAQLQATLTTVSTLSETISRQSVILETHIGNNQRHVGTASPGPAGRRRKPQGGTAA